ncbi:MAG TPA: glucose-6-phosphate dehydrogenase assembly protein OpcA [Candidatus Caenarcaniphilales bacterium]
MTTKSAPLVSLQSPKDVSLSEIEAELSKIWQGHSAAGGNGSSPAAIRAATFSLIVYEPEETQQLLATLGFYSGPIDGIAGPRTEAALRAAQEAFGLPVNPKSTPESLARLRQELAQRQSQKAQLENIGAALPRYALDSRGAGFADAIAAQNPCRVVALCPTAGEDEGVTAQVAAYCPIQKQSRSTLICCEYITLKGTAAALERVGSLITSLLIGELPKFLWWKATVEHNQGLFDRLAALSNCVIVDSSNFPTPEAELLKLQSLIDRGINIADLNWRRLAAWQELTAEAFDPPERRAALSEVDRVTIDYEKGNPAQALMFLGWLASRLKWYPTAQHAEGGDYDLKRIMFMTEDQRVVEAELAALPLGNTGEVAGDLIDLRLTSTNPDADCCTVLCSQTTGCMRMEAGGGAQSCRIQQVTPLSDQQAEELLSRQLQRWNRDVLYAESLAVTAQMLQLSSTPD